MVKITGVREWHHFHRMMTTMSALITQPNSMPAKQNTRFSTAQLIIIPVEIRQW